MNSKEVLAASQKHILWQEYMAIPRTETGRVPNGTLSDLASKWMVPTDWLRDYIIKRTKSERLK